jgi:hypothetical protein
MLINGPKNVYATAPSCIARAGDCELAWKIFQEAYPAENLDRADAHVKQQILQQTFESLVKKCKK